MITKHRKSKIYIILLVKQQNSNWLDSCLKKSNFLQALDINYLIHKNAPLFMPLIVGSKVSCFGKKNVDLRRIFSYLKPLFISFLQIVKFHGDFFFFMCKNVTIFSHNISTVKRMLFCSSVKRYFITFVNE